MTLLDVFKLNRPAREKSAPQLRPGTRILVANDSDEARLRLRHILHGLDALVAESDNAHGMFREIELFEPELIFLDTVLAGQSGFQLLRNLRRQPAHRDTPIIMLGSNDEAVEYGYVQKNGADGLIRSSLPREEILSSLQAVLDDQGTPRRPIL